MFPSLLYVYMCCATGSCFSLPGFNPLFKSILKLHPITLSPHLLTTGSVQFFQFFFFNLLSPKKVKMSSIPQRIQVQNEIDKITIVKSILPLFSCLSGLLGTLQSPQGLCLDQWLQEPRSCIETFKSYLPKHQYISLLIILQVTHMF